MIIVPEVPFETWSWLEWGLLDLTTVRGGG